MTATRHCINCQCLTTAEGQVYADRKRKVVYSASPSGWFVYPKELIAVSFPFCWDCYRSSGHRYSHLERVKNHALKAVALQ